MDDQKLNRQSADGELGKSDGVLLCNHKERPA